MLEYVPVDLLRDGACHKAAREPPTPESAFAISNGKLQLLNTTFDTLKEWKLSFDDWCKASKNLVDTMCKHLRAGDNPCPGGDITQAIVNSFHGHCTFGGYQMLAFSLTLSLTMIDVSMHSL